MKRDRIDWLALTTLPRKSRDGATREDAANRLFHAHKAKHKGRNHIQNWKRRAQKQQASASGKATQQVSAARAHTFIASVRAYWRGDLDEHP